MKKSIYKSLPFLILVFIIAIFCAVLDGYISIAMMHAIDTVKTKNMPLFRTEVVKLLITALILIPATVTLAFFRGLYKRKAIVSAKVNYIKGVFSKNINEFQKDNSAKYLSTLTNDVNTIETNYIDGLYEIVINSVNFVVAVIVIGIVSPIALGFGVGIGVISTLISIFLSKPLQNHHTQRSELYEGYTTYLKEVLSAFHIIKSNNLNDKVKNDFHIKSHAIQYKGYIIDKISTYIFSLQHLTMNLTFNILLGTIALLAIKGELTLGGAVLFVINMEKMMQPLSQIGEWLPKILATKKLFMKIDSTLKNQDNYEEKTDVKELNKAIVFSNVSFSYHDDAAEVLKDINFTLEKGGKYLVIGPSGGGKSTLLKLLRKYHAPRSGTIMIDGIDLKDVTKDSYFHHISNIEQQVFLFEDTVRNNICLYKDYTDKEINIAMEKAGLKDFIAGLPEGLSSIIYDNGKNVSGGEKSRIAIARGLLQRADIIFLDEAFASLDSEIAKVIENILLNLDNITVVNVSHVVFEDTKQKYSKVLLVKNKGVFSI